MLRGLQVSSGGVRGVWMRNGLKTRHERLLRLEETVRKRKVKLTEEQIQALERFDPEFCERHIEVHATGELVAVDTFFAGTLKGVGKVYIQTVLDCFSRYVAYSDDADHRFRQADRRFRAMSIILEERRSIGALGLGFRAEV